MIGRFVLVQERRAQMGMSRRGMGGEGGVVLLFFPSLSFLASSSSFVTFRPADALEIQPRKGIA